MHGMIGSSYTGTGSLHHETAREERAFWPKKTASGKRIWPGQKYVVVSVFFDETGRPPIYGMSWDRILTPKEYTVYLLTKDSKKNFATGQEFTGSPRASY